MNFPEKKNINESITLKPGSFVAVDKPDVIGQIVKIGSNGLIFQYTNFDLDRDVHVCDGSMLLGGNGIYVKGLKFHVIEEYPIQGFGFCQLDVRHVQVLFDKLTTEQMTALENYIRLNSDGHFSGMLEEIDIL